MKVYSLSSLVKEMSENFGISKRKSKKMAEFLVEKIVDNSINNKVFIRKFGTFTSKVVIKKSFNGLKISKGGASSNKDVISKEDSYFVTQKPKVVFLPSLEYRNKIIKDKKPSDDLLFSSENLEEGETVFISIK